MVHLHFPAKKRSVGKGLIKYYNNEICKILFVNRLITAQQNNLYNTSLMSLDISTGRLIDIIYALMI